MDHAKGEFVASVIMAGILANKEDGDVAEEDEEDYERAVVNAGQLFEFDEDDAVVERPPPSAVAPQSSIAFACG